MTRLCAYGNLGKKVRVCVQVCLDVCESIHVCGGHKTALGVIHQDLSFVLLFN